MNYDIHVLREGDLFARNATQLATYTAYYRKEIQR